MLGSWFDGDISPFHSFDAMATAATDVIRVEVLDERQEWINSFLSPLPPEFDPYRLYIVYRLRVLDVFQGDTRVEDVIEVRQRMHICEVLYWDVPAESIDIREIRQQLRYRDDIQITGAGTVSIVVGDDLFLFLHTSFIEGNPALLINPAQSAYRFSPAGIGRLQNLHIRPWGPSVTIHDLRLLAEANFGPSTR